MSQPLSHNIPGANASQSTVDYIPTQPNSPCTTDTGQTGKTRNPPSCPNAPHSLDSLGVDGTCYTEPTLNQFEQLGLDHQRANKLARKLHAHSVQYAHKLATTRRAIEDTNNSHSQVLEPGTSSNQIPISIFFL
eukprot:1146857-Pelagomonas_calceolata.AAC.1